MLALILTACSEPTTESEADTSTKGTSDLELSSDTVYLSEINGQYTVTAVFVDGNGVAYLDQPFIEWESASAAVATVDQNGVITATGIGETQIVVRANGLSKSIAVIVSDSVVTLSGQVRYEDREYSANGFVSKSAYYKAARFIKVDLVSADNTVLQSSYTDDQGNFSFTGVISSQQKVTVYTLTDANRGLNLLVKDRSDLLYAVTSNVSLDNDAVMSIDIPLNTEASGAFNILDVLTNAANFTLEHTTMTEVALAAFWEEDNYDGTYYCNGFDSFYCNQGRGIYIYNAVGSDTDEYDDDVLYHEFGHYFMDALSRDDSLGGCHLLSSQDLDLRLAWSEGFGDFFPAAVKHWLSTDSERAGLLSSAPSLTTTAYVDTFRSSAQISIALVNLDLTRYISAGNEMAIAKILYDLYLRYGMENLVSVLEQYLPSVATPVNLESFWDGWLAMHNPDSNTLSQLQTIFNERKIYYQDDAFENDDTVSSLGRGMIAKGSLEKHYLYKSVNIGEDIDVVPFSVTAGRQYTVQTLNLSGGTDTYLSVLDASGNSLSINGTEIANDDADENAYYGYDSVCGSSRVKNNGTALASRVSFTSPQTGTYYAKIRTTIDPDPYLSAGRYGNYDVLVQEN